MPDQSKFNFQNPHSSESRTKQEKEELQYNFADYWDELQSQCTREDETLDLPQKTETLHQASCFDFELKKQRPLWKDAVVFRVTVFSV